MPHRFYTTTEMKADLQQLVTSIKAAAYTPHLIAGILRGGLIPAVYLSHRFDIPMTSISLSLRDHSVHGLTPTLADNLRNQSVLVVDDLVDGGATLHQLCQWGQQQELNLRTAVLLHNPSNACGFSPDFYGQSVDKALDPRWIVFPWEEWSQDHASNVL